jgi:Icc-related predicted phosphoesterase
MTKILCVGDLHVMDRPPVNATESYTDDIIDMLHWIAGYAQEQRVDAVVWAGDIFHHKQPSRTSHALVLKMLEVVRDYRALGLDLCIVTGNHDISNDILESVHEKQPLGVLYAAGARELVGWHPKLPVFGVPWQQNWTTSDDAAWDAFYEWREAETSPGSDNARSLAVTHAPIYPPSEAEKKLFELVPTGGEHGISKAMGNVGSLAYGHIHEYAGIFEVEGVTYANMGALSRGSLTEYNIDREIKVALWEDGTFTEVPVPHKPASEVLRIAEAVEAKSEKISLDAFLSDIGSSTLDISSTGSVIEHIRGRSDVEPRIKKRAIEILEEVG